MSILEKPAPPLKQAQPLEPLGTPLGRVRWLLEYLDYPAPHVAFIVDHCRDRGTTEGCEALDESDRPHVKALLSTPETPVPAPAPLPVRRRRRQSA